MKKQKKYLPANITRKIQTIVNRIAKKFKPDQVLLFGSYARGTAGPDSDVDFLVVMPVEGSRREKQIEMRLAVHDIRIPKDIIVVTPDEVQRKRNVPGTIVKPAFDEGVILYERAG